MGVIRKGLSIGTLGTVGWNGQRATRAKNQKAQAKLARSEVGAQTMVAKAEAEAAVRVARAQERLIRAEVKAVTRTARAAPAAGWHQDPHGRYELRFWDGARWTEHVSTAGVSGVDRV
jgi:hypothetical protein